jgi:hypothetical protein
MPAETSAGKGRVTREFETSKSEISGLKSEISNPFSFKFEVSDFKFQISDFRFVPVALKRFHPSVLIQIGVEDHA